MNVKSLVAKLNNPNQLLDMSIKKAPHQLSKTTSMLTKEQKIEELVSDMTFVAAHDALSNVNKAALNIKK